MGLKQRVMLNCAKYHEVYEHAVTMLDNGLYNFL